MPSIVKQYLHEDKDLFPLKYKTPKDKKWTTKEYTRKEILAHQDNLGWRIGKENLIIDVDPRHGGDASLKRLQKDIGFKIEPTVHTPRGGFHCYLSVPDYWQSKKFRKKINDRYPGIDFLSIGAYVLISGCVTEDGGYRWADELFESFVEHDAPESLLELLHYKAKDKSDDDDMGDFEGLIGNSANWDEETVIEFLNKLDSNMDHDTWVKVGQALHDWDPQDGLKLWEDWSKDGETYEKGLTEYKWSSFTSDAGISLGTLIYLAKRSDIHKTNTEINEIVEKIKKIKGPDDSDLKSDIYPKVQKMKLSPIDRDKIASAVSQWYKDNGVKTSISYIRGNLTYVESNLSLIDQPKAPEWCDKYIYVNSHNSFVNKEKLTSEKVESFNLSCGKYVPMSESGTKPSAYKYVSDRGFIEQVDMMMYLPHIDSDVCTHAGLKVLNTFNKFSVPDEAENYTKEGRKAIRKVEEHFRIITGNQEYADILMQYIAHSVQYPGKKILWAPFIQSIEGYGKSFVSSLMRECLGFRNVGIVSSDSLTGKFNLWATGSIISIIEEVRQVGENRYHAHNKMKALITEDYIQIEQKKIDQYQAKNVTNYILFSNHRDALPLTLDDRRYFVIFIPFQSKESFSAYVGKTYEKYFSELFDLLRMNGDEIRKYMLEYPISDEFKNMYQAPNTTYKNLMITTEENSIDGYMETRELIEHGGEYYNKMVISSNELFDDVLFEYPHLELTNMSKNKILKKLGYSLMAKPVFVDGKTRRLWVQNPMSNAEARANLKCGDVYADDI